MRVVGGIAKGRKLFAVKPEQIRPTTDKVREAIFNVLGDRLDYGKALDLFSGSGALGIEALSRGVREVYFVDVNKSAVELITKNIDLCGFTDTSRVFKCEAKRAIADFSSNGERFNLILLDAPYNDAPLTRETLTLIAASSILEIDGIVVCEVSKKKPLAPPPEGFCIIKEKKYGDTLVYFLKTV